MRSWKFNHHQHLPCIELLQSCWDILKYVGVASYPAFPTPRLLSIKARNNKSGSWKGWVRGYVGDQSYNFRSVVFIVIRTVTTGMSTHTEVFQMSFKRINCILKSLYSYVLYFHSETLSAWYVYAEKSVTLEIVWMYAQSLPQAVL